MGSIAALVRRATASFDYSDSMLLLDLAKSTVEEFDEVKLDLQKLLPPNCNAHGLGVVGVLESDNFLAQLSSNDHVGMVPVNQHRYQVLQKFIEFKKFFYTSHFLFCFHFSILNF